MGSRGSTGCWAYLQGFISPGNRATLMGAVSRVSGNARRLNRTSKALREQETAAEQEMLNSMWQLGFGWVKIYEVFHSLEDPQGQLRKGFFKETRSSAATKGRGKRTRTTPLGTPHVYSSLKDCGLWVCNFPHIYCLFLHCVMVFCFKTYNIIKNVMFWDIMPTIHSTNFFLSLFLPSPRFSEPFTVI